MRVASSYLHPEAPPIREAHSFVARAGPPRRRSPRVAYSAENASYTPNLAGSPEFQYRIEAAGQVFQTSRARPTMPTSLGIDLGATHVKFVHLDDRGSLLAQGSFDTLDSVGPDWIPHIRQRLQNLLAAHPSDHVGLCSPGLAARD